VTVTTPNGAVELHTGDRVGPWLIIDQLGFGGSASVYRAVRADEAGENEEQPVEVALRICRPTDSRHLDAIVSTYATMPTHPAIVVVHETFVHELNGHAHVVCVTELSPGGTLEQKLDTALLLPDEARALSDQLIGGLAAFHSAGLVHGDVKPSNIMQFADTWKLVDPSATERSLGDTTTSVVTHERTLPYVAPEMLDTPGVARRAGDLWALGVTLHESLTGAPPFDSFADQVVANCRVNSTVPGDLARLIKKCVAPSASRPNTAATLRDWQRPVGPGSRLKRRHHVALLAALAIGVVTLVSLTSATETPVVDRIDFETDGNLDRFVGAADAPAPMFVADQGSTRLAVGVNNVDRTYLLAGTQLSGAVSIEADVRVAAYPSSEFGIGGPTYGLILKTLPSESSAIPDAYTVSAAPTNDGVRVRIGVTAEGKAGSVGHQYRQAEDGHSAFTEQVLFAGATDLEVETNRGLEPEAVELGYWQISGSLARVDGGVQVVAVLTNPSGTSESFEWIDQGENAHDGAGSVGIASLGLWSIEPRIDNFVVSSDG